MKIRTRMIRSEIEIPGAEEPETREPRPTIGREPRPGRLERARRILELVRRGEKG